MVLPGISVQVLLRTRPGQAVHKGAVCRSVQAEMLVKAFPPTLYPAEALLSFPKAGLLPFFLGPRCSFVPQRVRLEEFCLKTLPKITTMVLGDLSLGLAFHSARCAQICDRTWAGTRPRHGTQVQQPPGAGIPVISDHHCHPSADPSPMVHKLRIAQLLQASPLSYENQRAEQPYCLFCRFYSSLCP